MATGLTYVQRNNAEHESERRMAAETAERIIVESGDVASLWEAIKQEGMDDLIDSVLRQKDIDALVRDALARGGWRAVHRLLLQIPENFDGEILFLDNMGELVPFGLSDLEEDLRNAVDDL